MLFEKTLCQSDRRFLAFSDTTLNERHRKSPDYKEALKWIQLAAEQGSTWAQHNLGTMYQNGKGTPKNYNEAVKNYSHSMAT